MLGRTETRTRDRMSGAYCQTKRTVIDISRDDRARIATCSLQTQIDRQTDRHIYRQTDRRQENYSIDCKTFSSRVLKSFEYGVFTDNMKVAKVIPLFNAGNRSLFSNDRPIPVITNFKNIGEIIQ